MRGDVIKVGFFLLLHFIGAAAACDYPDEDNMPLRGVVGKMKYLPETEAWASAMRKAGAVVQYALFVERPLTIEGRRYWPVEVRADGRLWRRFYLSPDGKRLLR